MAKSKMAESKMAESKMSESKKSGSKMSEFKMAESKMIETEMAQTKISKTSQICVKLEINTIAIANKYMIEVWLGPGLLLSTFVSFRLFPIKCSSLSDLIKHGYNIIQNNCLLKHLLHL